MIIRVVDRFLSVFNRFWQDIRRILCLKRSYFIFIYVYMYKNEDFSCHFVLSLINFALTVGLFGLCCTKKQLIFKCFHLNWWLSCTKKIRLGEFVDLFWLIFTVLSTESYIIYKYIHIYVYNLRVFAVYWVLFD